MLTKEEYIKNRPNLTFEDIYEVYEILCRQKGLNPLDKSLIQIAISIWGVDSYVYKCCIEWYDKHFNLNFLFDKNNNLIKIWE
ncbi:MAG TPA: hypothetical protein VIK77_02705 [Tissierellaceae bacterium]